MIVYYTILYRMQVYSRYKHGHVFENTADKTVVPNCCIHNIISVLGKKGRIHILYYNTIL